MFSARMLAAALGLTAGLFGASTAVSAAQEPTHDASKAAITAAMHRYDDALRSSADDLANLFTEDGELLESGMDSLRGRAAIKGFLAPIMKQATVNSSRTDIDEIEVFGAVALLWGSYRQTVTLQGEPSMTVTGRLVVEWRRDSHNAWLVRRLIVQPFPPR